MSGRQFRIRGLVQGVGFRPYVWRLANELGLSGWVRNDGAGVIAAVNGKNWPKFKTVCRSKRRVWRVSMASRTKRWMSAAKAS